MTASTARITVDGATLAYRDVGAGFPVVFQHGLGADAAQPAELLPETPALRAVTAALEAFLGEIADGRAT